MRQLAEAGNRVAVRTLEIPGYILFFVMLFVPTTYPVIKAGLLAFVLWVICIEALWRGRIALHRTIFLWTLVVITTGLGFIALGLGNDAPGALRVSTVYVLWPLVYMVLVAGVATKLRIDGLFRVLVVATLAIGLYSLFYVFQAVDLLPSALSLEIDQGQDIGFHAGYINYRANSVASLLFLVPFLLAALLTWPKEPGAMPVARMWLWLAVILGIVLVLLSARKGLLLVVALAPVITVILRIVLVQERRLSNRASIFRVLIGFCLAVIALFFGLQFAVGLEVRAMTEMFLSGFDFETTVSGSLRKDQFFALVEGWLERPLLGMGHGASAIGSVRSEDQPWAYELSYLVLLFHTGIVGFSIYASGVAWIVWNGLKIVRSGDRLGLYMLPVLVGMLCFLIGNATNPYLEKYDFMWVIYLPVALINYRLLKGQVERLEDAKLARYEPI